MTSLEAGQPAQKPAEPRGPYEKIAADLRGAIASGILKTGDQLPTIKDLAARYDVPLVARH
ncbi:MAG: GntR family transcriptional regulator [Actinopolymorphaceae bacterium]